MSIRKYPDTPRVYFDMDGVLADYDKKALERRAHPSKLKLIPNIYKSFDVVSGAKETVAYVLTLGYQIFALSKPPSENPYSATDKLIWMANHFSEFEDRIILTPDKGCIGTTRDFLIDDHPEWANASNFPGTVIKFEGDWSVVRKALTK